MTGQGNAIMAILGGNTEALRALLQQGMNPDQLLGIKTPAQMVARMGHLDCLRLLCDHGASLDPPTPHREPLLLSACSAKTSDCAEYLLSIGASINATDGAGASPLHVAACDGATATIKVLVAAGADCNQETPEGITPLVMAADCEQYEAMLALLRLGARGDRLGPRLWSDVLAKAPDPAAFLPQIEEGEREDIVQWLTRHRHLPESHPALTAIRAAQARSMGASRISPQGLR